MSTPDTRPEPTDETRGIAKGADAPVPAPADDVASPSAIEERSITTVIQRKESFHAGPLPPPETFAGYEQVLPGSAERILRMAEIEQRVRHRHTRMLVWTERSGTLAAWSIAMTVLGGGIFLVWAGKDLGGLVAIVSGLAVLAGVFLANRKSGSGGPPSSAKPS